MIMIIFKIEQKIHISKLNGHLPKYKPNGESGYYYI